MARIGQVVITGEQVEALPVGTVLRDYAGDLAERRDDGWAWTRVSGKAASVTRRDSEAIASWEPLTIETLPFALSDEQRTSLSGGVFKTGDEAELVTFDHSLPSLRLLDGLRVRVNRVTPNNGVDWAHFQSDDFDARVGGVELTLPATCLRKIGNEEGKPTTIEYRGGEFDLIWTVEQLDALPDYSVIVPLGPGRWTPRIKGGCKKWTWNTAEFVTVDHQYANTCEGVLNHGAIVLFRSDNEPPSL